MTYFHSPRSSRKQFGSSSSYPAILLHCVVHVNFYQICSNGCPFWPSTLNCANYHCGFGDGGVSPSSILDRAL